MSFNPKQPYPHSQAFAFEPKAGFTFGNTSPSSGWNSGSGSSSGTPFSQGVGLGHGGGTGGGMGPPSERMNRIGSGGYSNGVNGTPGGPRGKASKDALAEAEAEAKRRKVQRACDICRRKKIRCEGPMTSASASKCATCQEGGFDCTYVEAAKRRGPPKGYIDTLEQRCGRLQRVLLQLHPGIDFTPSVGPPLEREDFDLAAYQDTLHSLRIPPYPSVKPFILPLTTRANSDVSTPSGSSPGPLGCTNWDKHEKHDHKSPEHEAAEAEASADMEMSRALKVLNIKDGEWRFHGKASGAHLFRTVNDLKYTPGYRQNSSETFLQNLNTIKRPAFWDSLEWEKAIAVEGVRPIDPSIWPDDQLAQQLIDAYFAHVNPSLPVLNGVLFRKKFAAGLHGSVPDFAAICLMVFANGSKHVNDRRVFWPADDDENIKYSAGYPYLLQVLRMGKSWLKGPTLYDLQVQVLLCGFMSGSTIPHLAWVVSGVAIRCAQEMGIHMRSTLVNVDPIERESLLRAFWCLYHVDRINCAAIGRSIALPDSDFDAEYPTAVDDEYWETGDRDTDLIQPPSAGLAKITSFIQLLKLDNVIGSVLRTIYAVNKPEDAHNQQAMVVELDSALNLWAESIPDGLKWDPAREDRYAFEQSALLQGYYYYVQILIHRPFIPTPKRRPIGNTTFGPPSLAICSNASRSICNILDALLKRAKKTPQPGEIIPFQFLLPALTAAIILLITVHLGKLQKSERERTLNDVKKCIEATRSMEVHWRQAGKMTDILVELSRESGNENVKVEEEDSPGSGMGSDLGMSHGVKRGFPEIAERSSSVPVISEFQPQVGQQQQQHQYGLSTFGRPVTPPNVFGLGPYYPASNSNSIGSVMGTQYQQQPAIQQQFQLQGAGMGTGTGMYQQPFQSQSQPQLQSYLTDPTQSLPTQTQTQTQNQNQGVDNTSMQETDYMNLTNPTLNPLEFYSDYGLGGGFEFPSMGTEGENDVWSQLFSGFPAASPWGYNQQQQ